MLKNARRRAKDCGVPFSITEADCIVPAVCPILGIPLFRGKGQNGFSDNSPSLDRIIPELGYVPGNVCVISYRANRIKSDASRAELHAIADYIDRHTQVL